MSIIGCKVIDKRNKNFNDMILYRILDILYVQCCLDYLIPGHPVAKVINNEASVWFTAMMYFVVYCALIKKPCIKELCLSELRNKIVKDTKANQVVSWAINFSLLRISKNPINMIISRVCSNIDAAVFLCNTIVILLVSLEHPELLVLDYFVT